MFKKPIIRHCFDAIEACPSENKLQHVVLAKNKVIEV